MDIFVYSEEIYQSSTPPNIEQTVKWIGAKLTKFQFYTRGYTGYDKASNTIWRDNVVLKGNLLYLSSDFAIALSNVEYQAIKWPTRKSCLMLPTVSGGRYDLYYKVFPKELDVNMQPKIVAAFTHLIRLVRARDGEDLF